MNCPMWDATHPPTTMACPCNKVAEDPAGKRGFGVNIIGRIEPEQRCRAPLGIEIDHQHAVARKGEMLGTVHGARCLRTSSFEVRKADDLKLIAWTPPRGVPRVAACLLQKLSYSLHFSERKHTSLGVSE